MNAVVHAALIDNVIDAWKTGMNVDESSQISPVVREGVKALRQREKEKDFDPCQILTPEFFCSVISGYSQF